MSQSITLHVTGVADAYKNAVFQGSSSAQEKSFTLADAETSDGMFV